MKAQRIKSFISHWLNKVDEHSIHSPYFFDFYKQVIKPAQKAKGDQALEKLRARLLQNNMPVQMEDLGAGSAVGGQKKSLADITQISVSPAKLSQLYFNILNYIDAKYVVELGTSIGLNTLYLSQKTDCRIFTFEGNKSLINIALTHFESLDRKNVQLIEGNIDHTLSEFLQNTTKINFALIDANHRYEPTLRYFNMLVRRMNEKSILVIDDIHWSAEMEKAWDELHRHSLVYGSIDLYRCGILFFDPALNRQHFTLSL
ncbi:MAG: class I SAM-dependent methyltransferase [Cyclobacteriaceae bacterium]